ncbi:UDP-2,4-diacetamido-2,4,6-trideoxy-beta-L-altropyranose hydrolase [Pseudomonas knackmussii]|uniref:UDP-2,4-diacetamido-2,4, 6-trideoxy-beta-L-altropyranose hydrolase n=1 Tax=Pseudomonas knackmussii TaxID=65741 RepID=UPI001362C852|nr:UDP-2,4-diacetamido-2,4,6-trideoxy-beta-L-altropyranose hydrolase [Pseudomonas knackmussii]
MNIVFRVDASLQMGTGHLMRCLTLADALKAQGASCHFICREHPGNLNAVVVQRGHSLSVLPYAPGAPLSDPVAPAHAEWLGASWKDDAIQTLELLADETADWLIVDHYALDRRWESQVAKHCRRLMVIDDLADRDHECDVLLDQNLGRQEQDYSQRVPPSCQLLLGPQFSLLRPEFAQLREQSLAGRAGRKLQNLLISMGGVDADNATGQVLEGLRSIVDPHWNIQVVMGATAPWRAAVEALAQSMPCHTKVLVNTSNMAELMSKADLAIGAAGSTSWERCCLGLPSIMLILAENQRGIAEHLKLNGAATLIDSSNSVAELLPIEIDELRSAEKLTQMSSAAERITDGLGTERVTEILARQAGSSHGMH